MFTSRRQHCSVYAAATLLAILTLPLHAVVTVNVNPATTTLKAAGGTKTFSASVGGTTNKAVSWFVNGVAGGNATVGTITTAGLYTAPAVVPANNVVTVKATSAADAKVSGTSAVTLQNPTPHVTSVTPNQVNVGTFTIQVKGTGFITASKIKLGDILIATTFISTTELKATATDNTARDSSISVANPDPGAAVSNTAFFRTMPPTTLNLSPEKVTLRLGVTRQFNASVANAIDKTSTFYVNDVKGGNATVGTISDTGLYTPPATLPPGATANIKAVSNANRAVSDLSVVTLQNAIPLITKVTPATLTIGADAQFVIDGTGFAAGAVVLLGSSEITIGSLTPTRIIATGKPKATVGGVTTISLRNPDPGTATSNSVILPVAPRTVQMTAAAASKFLNRTTWGPTPDSVAHLQEIGIQAFLNEQLNAPQSDYPDPIAESTSVSPAQRDFFINAMNGQDQLRQRVGFALSQIMVVSGVKTPQAQQLVPYMRILHRGAFGNYFTLLKDVTLHPTMGRFLDMVNNVKENPARGIEPNENYGRELLQLFTIGLVQLNMDGTTKMDSLGKALPAYSEDTVKQFARALTGWTFPTRPGEAPRAINPSYYAAPMIPVEENHDKTQKTLLNGDIVPAGRTAPEEVDYVITSIRHNGNVAPFVSMRLIQRLVMGNPSGAYIQRVANVFQSTGGDLWQTTRAIVTDPEADAPAANQGKLREPILFALSFLRGMNATISIDHPLVGNTRDMGQELWFAGSVFNYFSPFFRVNGIQSPEFQIQTPSIAMNRVNFIYRASRNGLGANVVSDLAHLERLASDPNALVEALNQALLSGGMSAAMKTSIITAVNATTDARVRARNAAYLVGSSSQFQVEP